MAKPFIHTTNGLHSVTLLLLSSSELFEPNYRSGIERLQRKSNFTKLSRNKKI